MPGFNERNVYFGPDALKNYFDPDSQPPLPLVELPERLNPYYKDGVRIYAKMMTMHPANNVKAMPGTFLASPFFSGEGGLPCPSPTCHLHVHVHPPC